MNTGSITPIYPQQGEVIDGKYQIERLLGEGGMGAVARAQHLLRRAPVALKFMSPHVMAVSGAVERFLNEGVAASQIDSENVVKVFDVGRLASGAPYLVMECLDGQDLSELLAREGTPGLQDVNRAVHFVLQALRGLQVAHDAGIIHRDMKPSNCFVIQKDGEPDFVKLLDFGISKVQQPGGGHLTQTNSALGTPLYMSPEQAKSARNVDLRSDIYSCSVILYELLTGRTPFFSESGEFTEILFKIFTTEPPHIKTLRPDLPPELADVIMRGLAREPNDRYASAADMAEALVPWADERSRQVVTRIRHRAANQGRPTGVPGSEIGSMVAPFTMPQTSPFGAASGASTGPKAVVGTPQHMSAADALARTDYSEPKGQALDTAVSAGGGASTELSATSDARPGQKAGRVPPILFAAPVVVLGIVGGLLMMRSKPADVPVRADPPIAATEKATGATQPPPTPSAVAPAPSVLVVTNSVPAPSGSPARPANSSQATKNPGTTSPDSSEPKKPRLGGITIHE